MASRDILHQLKQRFGAALPRANVAGLDRLYVFVTPEALKDVCQFIFRDLDARYIISIGADDRPYSGKFLVAHNFAFDARHVLCSVLTEVNANGGRPQVPSITEVVPPANWAEREFRDLVGIEPVGHRYPKRLVLPDGWPEGVHPLRKDVPHDFCPPDYDENRDFQFEAPPEGCVVVPFGPFHPTLDEPTHFRLYVEGETVRGCEYRGFMAHRGIEKLAETVLGYNDIPMMAERICGICGCVHNVAYAQAVENAAAIVVPPRAEYIRTIMLELERLHSHLLWVGLACHIVGFDTLFMQAFRIREPVMWMAEQISGNRKTYSLCVIGGVRWEITPELRTGLRQVLDKLEAEWQAVVAAVSRDRNLQRRTRGVGIATPELVKNAALIGPVARAAGVAMDCRRDHPYAAYDRVEFEVIVEHGGDVWSRVVVRMKEVFESIKIIRQCLDKMEPGPLQAEIKDELPPGRFGMSSVEAPRGESHHFVITGENNRPRRWRVRAPTYQNLQGIPAMIKDQQLADMTISLGSIDPCFSCTDRLEVVDIRNQQTHVWSQEELVRLARRKT
ncbi:NADH-quinone oxidoreductase subunit C [Fontisphaera persica]|uniref:hydrogenase large subunit n=1 Tax=Fontisphaera persica TaxID=2974023 RepID=UPI0024C0D3DA|nr:NADH-quinone oxidoreductase subunit C [Fontisphaera persica]WCJ60682.1 NADH-quinone oxidoreductase subunit C [Fontisphaera persica]